MTDRSVPHDIRNAVVDFVARWSGRTEIPAKQFVAWLGIAKGKFYDGKKRYGKANEHNGRVPRDHWIEEGERKAILDDLEAHPLEGYRRLTFMMLDEDLVAISPSTTYRLLGAAGLLDRWNPKLSKKGTGFVQPLGPPETLAHRHRLRERRRHVLQSNGKMKRWNQTIKATTIRPKSPSSLDEARSMVAAFVEHDNTVRLHRATGYVTRADKLARREQYIWTLRDRKLEAAGRARAKRREKARRAA